jgi:selenocysteine-specific elongation factor
LLDTAPAKQIQLTGIVAPAAYRSALAHTQHRPCVAGTVLQGLVAVGDTVEVAEVQQPFKVKSIQIFKQQVDSAHAGDRAGLCLPQLQANKIERTYVAGKAVLQAVQSCVCTVERCRFFSGLC